MNIADIFRRQITAERRSPDGAGLLSGIGVRPGLAHVAGLEATGARLPDAERIRALAEHSQAQSVVFQSIAAAALQILDRVLSSERRLATAAISLGQQEKLDQMILSLEATVHALRDALSLHGSKALNLVPAPSRDTSPVQEHSWWFALTDTMHVLEEGTAWIAGSVAGQPKGSATRLLSSIIARLLHSHYNKLLAEANQWME